MKKTELVFIPSPITGHLVSMVEIAKLIVNRRPQISITVLIIKPPFDSKARAYTESLLNSDSIRFINLPQNQNDAEDGSISDFFILFIERQKPHVKEAISKLESPQLAGFVIDSFCTTMIDVANEFEVPTYVFFSSSAAFLGLMFHLQESHDERNGDITEFKDSDAELVIPSSANPVPAKVLPSMVLNKDWIPAFLDYPRRFRETKGIMVNTFVELESYAINALSCGDIPPVYAVGPIVNIKGDGCDVEPSEAHKIIKWLDDQPASSVVFLCFGTMGGFSEAQVKEIAYALEHCGHRFLWSLRRAQPRGKIALPSEYADPDEVLPEGFLDRTAQIGLVIGWAPQVSILAHSSIGGFVSHCGWNSILESLWFGVPIATWPMYGEQQFNAFGMVIELGLGVEIKLDYIKDALIDDEIIVGADEIQRGIRRLMEHDSEIRKKVKDVSENSRLTVMDGGSSFTTLDGLISQLGQEENYLALGSYPTINAPTHVIGK